MHGAWGPSTHLPIIMDIWRLPPAAIEHVSAMLSGSAFSACVQTCQVSAHHVAHVVERDQQRLWRLHCCILNLCSGSPMASVLRITGLSNIDWPSLSVLVVSAPSAEIVKIIDLLIARKTKLARLQTLYLVVPEREMLGDSLMLKFAKEMTLCLPSLRCLGL